MNIVSPNYKLHRILWAQSNISRARFDLPGGANHSVVPFRPNRSSQRLPRLRLGVRTLEGLFDLTRRPSKNPWLTSRVASGTAVKQGHRHVCPTRRGSPRSPSRTADTNTLLVRLLKSPLFLLLWKFGPYCPPCFYLPVSTWGRSFWWSLPC